MPDPKSHRRSSAGRAAALRHFSWLAFAVCLLRPPCGAGEAPSSAAPLNVLLIVVDDLNTSLGCYGAPVKSPNVDRIAARGTRFDQSYCQYPLCNPSRVSFLTGRRPATTGVYSLGTPSFRALPGVVSLPEYFRRHGRFSGGAGKIFHTPKMSDPAAWDFYEDGNGEDAEEQAALRERYGGGDGRPAWTVLSGDGSRTRDGVNARTIARLIGEQTAARRPFFLAAGFHKPHLPWTAPQRFFDLYPIEQIAIPPEPAMRDVPAIARQTELTGFAQPESRAGAIRAYYACVSATDAQIGLLLEELDRRRLWETTLVALIGDNGFHLGDHAGLWAKLSAFEASTRVPFLLAGPGVPAGRVISSPVELLDLYPTLVDLAGLPMPEGLQGRTLVPTLRATPNASPGFATSVVYHYDPERKIDIPGISVISAEWRYMEWAGGREGREFYSRKGDPGEYVNRVNDRSMGEQVREGAAVLAGAPEMKPGPAERPRALLPKKGPKPTKK